MNTIRLNTDDTFLTELLNKTIDACAACEGVDGIVCDLSFVSPSEIKSLNKQMRGTDSVTDVLSFPEISWPKGTTARLNPKRLRRALEPDTGLCFIGDIVINPERAREQANEYGHSLKREICYLAAHGVFHLLGYDHLTDEDKAKMRLMEKAAMKKLEVFKTDIIEELKLNALAALENSYSPYSHFRVGACILCEDGRMFSGANFENASLGATICAERCAVANAIAHGARSFTKIAIAGDAGLPWPCGICRQVLNEFRCGDMEVITVSAKGECKSRMLSELLPEGFGPGIE